MRERDCNTTSFSIVEEVQYSCREANNALIRSMWLGRWHFFCGDIFCYFLCSFIILVESVKERLEFLESWEDISYLGNKGNAIFYHNVSCVQSIKFDSFFMFPLWKQDKQSYMNELETIQNRQKKIRGKREW